MHALEIFRLSLWHLLGPHSAGWSTIGRWLSVAAIFVSIALLFAAWRRGPTFASSRLLAGGAVAVVGLLGSSWSLLLGGARTLSLEHEMAHLQLGVEAQCEELAYFSVAGGLAVGITVFAAGTSWLRSQGAAPWAAVSAVLVLELVGVAPLSNALRLYAEAVDPFDPQHGLPRTTADGSLDGAHVNLVIGLAAAGVAVLAATMMARSGGARRWSRRELLIVTIAAAAGTALLSWRTRPLHDEITTPLPIGYAYHEELGVPAIPMPPFPNGEGPDDLVEAPTVRCDTRVPLVDGVQTTDEELAAFLGTKRDLWRTVQPGRRFPGQVIVSFRPDAPMTRVSTILALLRPQGYEVVLFAFTRQMTIERPVVGTLHGRKTTGIRLWLAPRAGATVVDASRFPRFGEWAEALLEERRQGREVALAGQPGSD
jgi:hypothetical protein